MSNPASLGTPCLVPAQLETSAGLSCRGFITRLAPNSAAVSVDADLPIGSELRLRFRRPADNEEVEERGRVTELLGEGGLWRGRAAALVTFDGGTAGDWFGHHELPAGTPMRRGSESQPAAILATPEAAAPGPAGLGGSLRTVGLGKRRSTAAPPGAAPGPALTPPAPRPAVTQGGALPRPAHVDTATLRVLEQSGGDPSEIRALSDQWAAVQRKPDEEDSTAPPRLSSIGTGEHDLPDSALGPLSTPGSSSPSTFEDFLSGTGDLPAVHGTDGEMPAVAGAPGGQGDDDFFGRFGRVSDLPEYSLPPSLSESGSEELVPDLPESSLTQEDFFAVQPPAGVAPAPGGPRALAPRPAAGPRSDESLLGTGSWSAHPRSEPPIRNTTSLEAGPDWAPGPFGEAPGPAQPHPPEPPPAQGTRSERRGGAGSSSGSLPPVAGPPPAPIPVPAAGSTGEIHVDRARPPWESGSDAALQSLIPRNARIASSIPVTFWARGKRQKGTAHNFSREGVFVAFEDEPPVRGAIVRLEFPVEGDGETVPVRFNAMVRWHRSDQPQLDLPRGFGVQILTFESAKDRGRYDELLLLILRLHQDREQKEAPPWGAQPGAPRRG